MASLFTLMARLILIFVVLISNVGAIDLNVDDQDSIKSAAATVAYGLQSLYTGNKTGGVLGKFPYPPYYWWESGAAWGAMINYAVATGDESYNDVTLTALTSQISSTNDFMPQAEVFDLGNDDQAFWVLAAMSAVEHNFSAPPSPYPSWLTICENVFQDYVNRWDTSTCAGGLRWQIYSSNAGYTYKNSISNGGFFQLAARLARYTGKQKYVDWANKIWDWTTDVGLLDSAYNVYDGTDDTEDCTSVNHLQWTYNVGMYLYGAAVLQNHTNGGSTWVKRTNGLLGAASSFTSPFKNSTNVLFEPECETAELCNTDQLSMKGYLARWLAGTSVMAPSTAGTVGKILQASALGAASACSGGTDGTTCGFKWYVGGWDGTSGMGQQLCALDVMNSLLINSAVPPATSSEVSSSSSAQSSTSTSASGLATSAVASSGGSSRRLRRRSHLFQAPPHRPRF